MVIIGIPLFRSDNDDWEILGMFLTLAGGMVLVIALFFIFLSPLEIKGDIIRFESTRQSIMIARETGNELEKAAIQHKIINGNQWLAGIKYWNETIFDIFIPDEVMQLKPLK